MEAGIWLQIEMEGLTAKVYVVLLREPVILLLNGAVMRVR